MDDRNVIAIMATSIYAARTGNREFGSREGMDDAVDEARMIFGFVKSLPDDDLVMQPFPIDRDLAQDD
jgi:hypothetical protein